MLDKKNHYQCAIVWAISHAGLKLAAAQGIFSEKGVAGAAKKPLSLSSSSASGKKKGDKYKAAGREVAPVDAE